MAVTDFLERIALNDRQISFNRMSRGSANYFHWHQCLEMLFISQGYGIVIVDNQQYTLRPGRLFVFPPFKLHKVFVEQSEKNHYIRTTVHLDHQLLDGFLSCFPQRRAHFSRLWGAESDAHIFDLADNAQHIETILESFQRLQLAATPQWEDIAMMILQLMEFMPEQQVKRKTVSRTTASKVMQWIEENYVMKFSLAELSAAIGLSQSYISRVFSQETGGSVVDYLATRRIKRACELLRSTDMRIEEVGSQCGFTDTPYFITCFRKLIGRTPLQYRKAAFRLEL
ncbi:MAG: AraC family transcriptional regulator [Ewingella americana]|jgi:AraC-like DNA-binding protein|uniref:AraC family transcriptional regulator n=1 Tax=Ewingella americana TaxID=41202 RepID=UPI00243219C6|nr:AraC family transcriptional regulator [Ewingella americana]MCI1680368.1 AraC family transcriptional regulator [Ewingella americana]MCI1854519.1 AraC family transcriptional regulator [Ewingella americana]MCI1860706.1 AraC family transcriptional regulator [Ewingella americana]MCI2143890.1 AraC family transcriptional regulator [Ewingella americana]MCI2164220.1 AraC family transcriptional regulator [Ewingella americana]